MKTRNSLVCAAMFLLVQIHASRGESESVRNEAADLVGKSEFADVTRRMNYLFEVFDDVITSQATRVSKDVTVVNDIFDENMVELIEEAEDLDDSIRKEIRDEEERRGNGHRGQNDEWSDTLDSMKASAVSMVNRASHLLDDVINFTGSSVEDVSLQRHVESTVEGTKDVLTALKSVATKRKVKQWKAATRLAMENEISWRNTSYDDETQEQRTMAESLPSGFDVNVQSDSPSVSSLRSSYLAGKPASRPFWQYPNGSRHKPKEDSGKLLETSSRYTNKQSNAVTLANQRLLDPTNLANYLTTCPDCAGLTTNPRCPMHGDIQDFRRWSRQLHNLLTNGCEKPESCKKPGTCCLNRKYRFQQTVNQMTKMMKEMFDVLNKECQERCAEDGYQADPAWTVWSAWSACDVTCGQGVKERRRQCANAENGRNCEGKAMSVKACRMPSCCSDGKWSLWGAWSACSASCGRGTKERTRRCDGRNQCGESCRGPIRERIVCTVSEQCCVDGNWGGWARWSACSASCGQGITYRNRKCNNPSPNSCGKTCPGIGEERRRCGNEKDCCVDGNWSTWTRWSGCSVTCGTGGQSRVRRCDRPSPNFCGQRCPGKALDTKACNPGTCCVDGNWSQWGAWEACSASCGRGSQMRRRRCDSPSANGCGKACPGQPMDIRACQQGSCCVDGNWGGWAQWTQCSATCGYGFRNRKRSCDRPAPNSCGRACSGSASEIDRCNSGKSCKVCVDGNWSAWTGWTSCSKSCGNGLRERSRKCNNPPANDCGRKCVGQDIERFWCNMRPCVTTTTPAPTTKDVCEDAVRWSVWSPWSSCSVTCDTGVIQRLRTCQNAYPDRCRQRCPGTAKETQPCKTGKPCCEDGNWSPWSPYSACSASCGGGRRKRSRACNDPPPNYCGKKCPGQREMSLVCNTSPCLTTTTPAGGVGPGLQGPDCGKDVQWSAWSPWASCSVTCDSGVRERVRQCENRYPRYCKNTCPGSSRDKLLCQTNTPCCVDGNWSPWSPWSACDVSCGGGRQKKSRTCNNPFPNHCGKTCRGDSLKYKPCNNLPCPVTTTQAPTGITPARDCNEVQWSSWSPWTRCSATCGSGIKERIRKCDNPYPDYCRTTRCPGRDVDEMPCSVDTPCCVDGNWGIWSPWSTCSASCGRGTKERRRRCDSPPANHCGQSCVGREYDTETCQASTPCQQPCAMRQWTQWDTWGSCSQSCGVGSIRQRRMKCEFVGGLQGLRDCGTDSFRACQGDRMDQESCSTLPACIVKWSEWSPCSATCRGQGVRERRTIVDLTDLGNVKANASQIETQACNVLTGPECPSWGPWGSCSATCRGQGVRQRKTIIRRDLTDGGTIEADARQIETQTCYTSIGPECPSWGPWGPCSATCKGPGVRERRVLGPVDNERNRPVETKSCFAQEPQCPDLLQTLEWEQWGPCSAACKGQGVRTRRTVLRTRLNSGTIEADARQTETEICNVSGPECPQCIISCRGRTDGMYPTCSSCQHAMMCKDGRIKDGVIMTCPGSTQWDAFINKCVTAPSPTCTLKDCVKDCRDVPDGLYHFCGTCSYYVRCTNGRKTDTPCPDQSMEFNQITGTCSYDKSPTCKRAVTKVIHAGSDPDIGSQGQMPTYILIGDPWQRDDKNNKDVLGRRSSSEAKSNPKYGTNQGHSTFVSGTGTRYHVRPGQTISTGQGSSSRVFIHQTGQGSGVSSAHQTGQGSQSGIIIHQSGYQGPNSGVVVQTGSGSNSGFVVQTGSGSNSGVAVQTGSGSNQGIAVQTGTGSSSGVLVNQHGQGSYSGIAVQTGQGHNTESSVHTGQNIFTGHGADGVGTGQSVYTGQVQTGQGTHTVHTVYSGQNVHGQNSGQSGQNVYTGQGSQTGYSVNTGQTGQTRKVVFTGQSQSGHSSQSGYTGQTVHSGQEIQTSQAVYSGQSGSSGQSGQTGQSNQRWQFGANTNSYGNVREGGNQQSVTSIRANPGCIMSCQGQQPGRYASCEGCRHFFVCYSNGGKKRTCSRSKLWDDNAKKCLRQSTTCQ